MQKIDSAIIAINNMLARRRGKPVPPENILMLVSSCLQNSKCSHNLNSDILRCQRCGNCVITRLIELAERKGIRIFMATGGSIALKEAMRDDVLAIVAVACEKELREGIFAAFKKRILGVVNLRPSGPCRDCTVHLEDVEKALKVFLQDEDAQAGG